MTPGIASPLFALRAAFDAGTRARCDEGGARPQKVPATPVGTRWSVGAWLWSVK